MRAGISVARPAPNAHTDRGPRAREPEDRSRASSAAVRACRPTRRSRAPAVEPVAGVDPVARVLVETPLAHLDRPFDYAVPESMAGRAVPGARVKVRFAGKDLDGFVVARAASSEHTGTLTPLRRVVSPEPVLLPAVADLAGVLAERYAGTRADVLRLAVPARHATTEARESPPEEPIEVDPEPLAGPGRATPRPMPISPTSRRRLAACGVVGAAR